MSGGYSLISTVFSISGPALDPDDCTHRFGLAPLSSCATPKVTARYFDGTPHVRKPFWTVGFEKVRSESVDDGLTKLLDLLWPKRTEVVEFLRTGSSTAAFVVSVSIYGARPLYVVSPETLQRLAFFGVELSFDIFDFEEPSEEGPVS